MVVEGLSARETEVLWLVLEGLTASEAAERLHVTPDTVKSHLKQIYRKLEVHSRLELARRVQSGTEPLPHSPPSSPRVVRFGRRHVASALVAAGAAVAIALLFLGVFDRPDDGDDIDCRVIRVEFIYAPVRDRADVVLPHPVFDEVDLCSPQGGVPPNERHDPPLEFYP